MAALHAAQAALHVAQRALSGTRAAQVLGMQLVFAQTGPLAVEIAKIRPNSVDIGPKAVEVGPTSTKVEETSSTLAQTRPNLGRLGQIRIA